MKNTDYHPGKLKPFAQIIAQTIRNNPAALEDNDLLWGLTVAAIPGLAKKETCPNCSASMQEYVFEFDLMDALLLLAMAREVSNRLQAQGREGQHMTFTEANQIKTTRLDTSYAARSRTTQCSKLGLVAKYRGKNGKQVPGTWVITSRGFAALAGKPVPKAVRVWRGQILERPEETITIAEALRSHEAKIEETLKKKKQPRTDYRDAFSSYDPEEWVHFGGVHQGELL